MWQITWDFFLGQNWPQYSEHMICTRKYKPVFDVPSCFWYKKVKPTNLFSCTHGIIVVMTETTPECSVCCEDYSIIQQISSSCGHNDVCSVCIKRHIEAELNSKGGDVQVRCPKSRCSIELTYEDVRRLASKDLFERWRKKFYFAFFLNFKFI